MAIGSNFHMELPEMYTWLWVSSRGTYSSNYASCRWTIRVDGQACKSGNIAGVPWHCVKVFHGGYPSVCHQILPNLLAFRIWCSKTMAFLDGVAHVRTCTSIPGTTHIAPEASRAIAMMSPWESTRCRKGWIRAPGTEGLIQDAIPSNHQKRKIQRN